MLVPLVRKCISKNKDGSIQRAMHIFDFCNVNKCVKCDTICLEKCEGVWYCFVAGELCKREHLALL